jgi:hypothetical protein
VKIAGAWVGLGLGDSSDEIRKIKSHLRKKFSYAKNLSDTPAFDQQMFDVVYRMQSAYYGQGKLGKPTGIIDRATKIACGYLPPPPPIDSRPVLFTVCGTGVPWWVGPDADTARAVESRYLWAPVGYAAAPFPMNQSAQEGRQELCRLFDVHRARVEQWGAAMIGYSQGAIVTSECFMFDIRPEGGRLHWALPHMRKACTFGNPMREQGRVWADAGAAPAPMTSHGIADQLLTDTPPWWRDYAHKSDLYSDQEGQSAEDCTAVYKVIMGTRFFKGPDNLLAQFLELAQNPLPEATGMFKAIVDAGLFFARGTGPHVNYSPQAAIDYLLAG